MTGVILFRAQPFHNGHLAQIKRAIEDAENYNGMIYIFVGSADKYGTKRNPIPIDMRLNLVNNSLLEKFGPDVFDKIHVTPLADLSDEANNTYSWGNYLYNKMCEYTGDTDFVFYYSDKPEIALSWFDSTTISHIYFRFLPRVENIRATSVRTSLARLDRLDRLALETDLPPYVYSKIDELHNYIVSAR